jgi:NAD(P)-dependent dehydrogenase (short-subunit alcohol dehydrogenase family)
MSLTAPTQPLAGRAALITGANRGLGLEIAKAYAASGAKVFLCARDGDLLEQAAEEVRAVSGKADSVAFAVADIGRREDVEGVVRASLLAFPELDILVNNAGVYGPMGGIEDVDWDEWVRCLNINLLGSVLTIRAVLPHMKRRGGGKIIQLSGGGATNPMPGISAYAVSKAAIVRTVETVALECAADHIDVNAIAPGALNTRMLDEVLEAGPDKVGADFYERAIKQKESGGAGFTRGAELVVFLASRASDGITGRLISAIWDRWEDWPRHLDNLASSDLYTLRRITGRDRGETWGDR